MMSRFYKVLSLFVAGVIVSSVLFGCNGKSSENEQKASSQASTKVEEPVTIDYLAYQSAGQPEPNSEVVKQVEKRYNAKFNFWFIDDQKWDDTLNLKLASGDMPDVFRLKIRQNIEKYVKQGILAELPEEKIRKLAPNYAKVVDQYDKEKMAWNATKYNGKNYGFTMISLKGTYPTNLVWRTDWLNNVGITKIPETLQEFETALYKFRNDDPDKNGKKDTYGLSNMTMASIMGAFGAYPISDFRGSPLPQQLFWTVQNGKVTYEATKPEVKEGLKLLQKWYKDGIIDPEFITGENKGGYWAISHAFINGRVGLSGNAMYYHYAPPLTEGDQGGAVYQELKKANIEYEKMYNLGKAPVGPNGKSGSWCWGYLGESIGVTSKCAKDDRKVQVVLKMLDDLHSDYDYYLLTSFGIKDKDFKLNKDNVVIQLGDVKNSEQQKMGAQVFNYLSGNPVYDKKVNPPSFAFADKVASFPGYIQQPLPTTDAFTKYNANLTKLTIEAYIAIISGTKPIDYFDEYVKTFKANGGDEIEKSTTEAYKVMVGK